MYPHLLLDLVVKQHISELHREAELERLANEASRNGRSLRIRLAEGLYALAARIEGRPRVYSDELPAAA